MGKACAKLSLLFLLTATICLIIGVTTSNWQYVANQWYSGLWEKCSLYENKMHCHTNDLFAGDNGWFQVVRVLEVVSCVMSAVNVFSLIIYILKEVEQVNKLFKKTILVITLITGLLILAGVIIYAVKTDDKLGWSFILATLGGCLTELMVLPLAVEFRKSRMYEQYDAI